MRPQIIFQNQHYTACEFKGSLIVTNNRKGGGKQLVGPQAAEWIEAIRTALDAREANDLCRAVANA